jgi:4-aminobutyrate aminotransferase
MALGNYEKKTFLGNSNVEAIEAAVKLAKWHTRKQLLIGFNSAFHGRTVCAISFAASKPAHRRYSFS